MYIIVSFPPLLGAYLLAMLRCTDVKYFGILEQLLDHILADQSNLMAVDDERAAVAFHETCKSQCSLAGLVENTGAGSGEKGPRTKRHD